MYETSGSVAYSAKSRKKTSRHNPILTTDYRKRHNALSKRIAVNEKRSEEIVIKQLHSKMTKERVGFYAPTFLAIIIVALAFSGILVRSSDILKLNYANVTLEKQIAQYENETKQIREELAKKTDLKVVRTIAVDRLRMQDPGQKQIVNVIIPQTDSLILNNESDAAESKDVQMGNIYNNIEGFFKTVR
jgi:hypothetical protein